jgi:16S rRNA (adenine(1408)-N(1))-methyltransferase
LAAAYRSTTIDLGAGDGRFVLARAAAHPDELALAVDASHAAMRQASRHAARSARRGGLPNAVFLASAVEAMPAGLNGLASVVSVHFPWGSLLRAAIGEDPAGCARLAALVAAGGTLRMLVSAADRDAGRGATHLDPGGIVAAYRPLGLEPDTSRPGTLVDVAEARSSWGRRLLTSGADRTAWLVELRKHEAAPD